MRPSGHSDSIRTPCRARPAWPGRACQPPCARAHRHGPGRWMSQRVPGSVVSAPCLLPLQSRPGSRPTLPSRAVARSPNPRPAPGDMACRMLARCCSRRLRCSAVSIHLTTMGVSMPSQTYWLSSAAMAATASAWEPMVTRPQPCGQWRRVGVRATEKWNGGVPSASGPTEGSPGNEGACRAGSRQVDAATPFRAQPVACRMPSQAAHWLGSYRHPAGRACLALGATAA
jgi:hypothetical protein